MEVVFDSKGDFDNIQEWLDKVASRSPNAVLNKIAIEGEESLAAGTPRDTGATAQGWQAKITSKQGMHEIAWYNRAHPETSVNVAVIIDQGHGTGTGGFVPPKPYIVESMNRVFDTAGDKIEKELIE
jgi:hypothetical protein